jgi:hypothetical protein
MSEIHSTVAALEGTKCTLVLRMFIKSDTGFVCDVRDESMNLRCVYLLSSPTPSCRWRSQMVFHAFRTLLRAFPLQARAYV